MMARVLQLLLLLPARRAPNDVVFGFFALLEVQIIISEFEFLRGVSCKTTESSAFPLAIVGLKNFLVSQWGWRKKSRQEEEVGMVFCLNFITDYGTNSGACNSSSRVFSAEELESFRGRAPTECLVKRSTTLSVQELNNSKKNWSSMKTAFGGLLLFSI